MSRNTGTKTKKCLVFQFYRIDNVYYFRFIKLKVSPEIRKTENVMPNVIAQISKE